MMRPLYRWKSFWLGILVLAFIGWVWVRSMSHLDRMRFKGGGSSWTLELLGGRISVEGMPTAGASGWAHGFEIDSRKSELSDTWRFSPEWLPPAIEQRTLMDEVALAIELEEGKILSVGERTELVEIMERPGGHDFHTPTRFFACWFLLLMMLVPWASFLAWRWRRMKRRTEPASVD